MADARPSTNAMLLAASGSVLLGVSVVGLRAAVRDFTPGETGCARFIAAGVILGAFLLVRGRFTVPASNRSALVVAGMFLFALNPLLFTEGVKFTTAAQAALMLASIPLWSMLFARIAGREQLTARKIAGSLVTCAGVATVLVDGLSKGDTAGADALLGDGLCLAAAACAGLYSVIIKRVLATSDALSVAACAMIVGGLTLLPIALFDLSGHVPQPTTASWLWLVFVAVLGGALAFGAWNTGLQKLTPTQASVFLNLNPIAASAVGAVTLREAPGPAWMIGLVLVVAGLLFVARAPVPRSRDLTTPR
jgi:drug/metabolite transporter (DMT)-like permease